MTLLQQIEAVLQQIGAALAAHNLALAGQFEVTLLRLIFLHHA